MFIPVGVSVVFHLFMYAIACTSLYRAVAFVHEIIHQRGNKKFCWLFTLVWHFTAGAIAFMPTSVFLHHLEHHSINIFGTERDDQYFLWRSPKNFLLLFVVVPLVMPLLNLGRSLIPPCGFNRLKSKARKITAPNGKLRLSKIERIFYGNIEKVYFFWGWIFIITLPLVPSIHMWWYLVSVGAWFLSALRVPLEHDLRKKRVNVSFQDQIDDSFNFKRSWKNPVRSLYSLIVQPVGLNWHQKHHQHPYAPYYKLKEIK